jgi:hypothetical protein
VLCATDIYGPLPQGRFGARLILVVLDVFSKHIKLYPLKSATTKSCLTKIAGHYLTKVKNPAKILSDNGTQFSIPAWKKKLAELVIESLLSPVRMAQSNPAERWMREIGKIFKIYCSQNHRKWPELIPYIENWINQSVVSSTGYPPIELMEGKSRLDLFASMRKDPGQLLQEESTEDKSLRAYERMKLKADRRNRQKKRGRHQWDPQVDDLVLAKQQAVSEANAGFSSKLVHPFHGPFKIVKVMPPAMFQLTGLDRNVRGVYQKGAIKAYLQPAARLGLGALGSRLGPPKLGGPKSITKNPFFLVLQYFGCKLQFGRFLVANAATKL